MVFTVHQVTDIMKIPRNLGKFYSSVIKAHGSSNAWAIRNAVRQAQSFARSTYIADVQENIEFMKVNSAAENA